MLNDAPREIGAVQRIANPASMMTRAASLSQCVPPNMLCRCVSPYAKAAHTEAKMTVSSSHNEPLSLTKPCLLLVCVAS